MVAEAVQVSGVFLAFLFLTSGSVVLAEEFNSFLKPLLEQNCVKCHGVEKSKGKVTLHDIRHDFGNDEGLEHWELILDVLQNGEMPPEEETQRPSKKEVSNVTNWIEKNLRMAITANAKKQNVPLVRRLTNFEYENTIRDLIGFRLKLSNNLPTDPEKPYHFNNTASFMLLGPEQMDRYLENARKIMASVLVDPEKPQVDRLRREWKPYGLDRGMGLDEIGIWGNRRHSPADGIGLKSFPDTGEFREGDLIMSAPGARGEVIITSQVGLVAKGSYDLFVSRNKKK